MFGLTRVFLFFATRQGSCPYSSSAGSHDTTKGFHKGPLPESYSGGLKEFSVVYTDRALNHMSDPFIKARGAPA